MGFRICDFYETFKVARAKQTQGLRRLMQMSSAVGGCAWADSEVSRWWCSRKRGRSARSSKSLEILIPRTHKMPNDL